MARRARTQTKRKSSRRTDVRVAGQVRRSGKLLHGIARRVARRGVKLINRREGVPTFTADAKDPHGVVRDLDGRKVRGRFVRGRFKAG